MIRAIYILYIFFNLHNVRATHNGTKPYIGRTYQHQLLCSGVRNEYTLRVATNTPAKSRKQ